MRTLQRKISVGVYGQIWAEQTVEMIRDERIIDYVGVFEYAEREALFIDQYDYFIITDFGRDLSFGSDLQSLIKLNQMREIVATRSMRTTLIVNYDDIDVATAISEACCRLVKVSRVAGQFLPSTFLQTLTSDIQRRRLKTQIPMLKTLEIESAVA